MATPIGPPPKPTYPSQARLSLLAAQYIARFVDANSLLTKELSQSDNHCYLSRPNASLTVISPLQSCSSYGVDKGLVTPLILGEANPNYRNSSTFPLPPLKTLGRIAQWTSKISPTSYTCIYMLSITLTIAACWCFEWLMHEGGFERGSYIWTLLKAHVVWESVVMALMLGISLHSLTTTVAKGALLSVCVANNAVSDTAGKCVAILAISRGTASASEIKAWSIWHAIFYEQIIQSSVDDRLLIPILFCMFFSVWSTLPGHWIQNFILRVSQQWEGLEPLLRRPRTGCAATKERGEKDLLV
ncbi:hypothetical protein B0H67DRAFT_2783 [Lasiosphaeris hirsuta]|uniref:Uncharacterized protein n=1 Tax=Lasiosphaeris hirsuta TaxID=260670 RepID=A0AA40EA12_9PEZI|nr:hypothetical protein B0H67DRAFT_2783 [Lasiosphaeris hirsuta]